jgi:hypothetical protein
MRQYLLLVLGATVFTLTYLSMGAQSAKHETSSDASSNSLCSKDRIICVPDSVANSVIENPFRIDVQINSTDDIYVTWEIRDNTGQVLEASSTIDYTDEPTKAFTFGRTLHILAFIFATAKTEQGTLSLAPSRYTIQTGGVSLTGVTIPVRLTTAKSTVTILEPANSDELKNAVIDWVEGEHGGEFNPKLKLITRHIEIMRFDKSAIIGATAEAVLRSFPGQGQWHVTHWEQIGSTAHITLVGSGWAGVSYYAASVSYLIEKSVLNLPDVQKLIFDREQ